MRRSKDKGISTAYFEAVAKTYDIAKDEALKGIRLSQRDVRFKEAETGPDGVRVRAISIRTRVEEAKRDLKIFLDGIGIQGEITGREEFGLLFMEITGPELGLMIGRGGMTLDATEYLLNIIHNRRFTPRVHIILDIGGYRRKDIEYIDSLITRAVQHIANRGKPFNMPPMSPKKRKLTHLLTRRYPGHISQSVGEEPRRRVEIRSAENEQSPAVPDAEPTALFDDEPVDEPVKERTPIWEVEDEGSPLY